MMRILARRSAAARLVTVLLAGLLPVIGCGHFSQEDGQKLQTEVYALQTRLAALQKAFDEQLELEEAQREQIAVMSRDLGRVARVTGINNADVGVELDGLKQEIGRLTGRVETLDERLTVTETGTTKLQEEVEVRFQGLAEQQKIERAQTEQEKRAAIAEARTRERLLSSPSKAVAEAKALLKKGQPAEARLLLRDLIIRNKGRRSFLRRQAPEAHFLIGKTYFAEGDYRQAANAYNTVRKRFPKSKLVPEALLQIGVCFEKLELPDDAKVFYNIIVQEKRFARTSAAKEAKAALARLAKK